MTTKLLIPTILTSLEAGAQIMHIFRTKIRISIKRNLTPVTNADKLANQTIIEGLAEFNIPMISEETKVVPFEERAQWDRFWLVDPLDGTKEFIAHRDDFTVNIALVHQGIPVMGVIYAPAYDILYFASAEIGSFRLRDAAQVVVADISLPVLMAASVRLPDVQTDTMTFVVSRSHINRTTQKYLDLQPHPKQFVPKGSSLKLCAIAEGTADEYPRFGRTMEWDIAAGDAILRHAGGKVFNAETRLPLIYNKRDLANPEFIASRR